MLSVGLFPDHAWGSYFVFLSVCSIFFSFRIYPEIVYGSFERGIGYNGRITACIQAGLAGANQLLPLPEVPGFAFRDELGEVSHVLKTGET